MKVITRLRRFGVYTHGAARTSSVSFTANENGINSPSISSGAHSGVSSLILFSLANFIPHFESHLCIIV